ncbi:unnamed protein product [Dibothriocephalus latus]|uniref:Uncharacterized protein n=1 Tax=Dibothriocephalus latus TaxID=60516 RepID=A0A3P7PZF8_DIBLA|nr:unnamed protein product [Dibothriocephalus latus]
MASPSERLSSGFKFGFALSNSIVSHIDWSQSSDWSIAMVEGIMSDQLDYITFFGSNSLVPITIFFFNNGTWCNSAAVHSAADFAGKRQPHGYLQLRYFWFPELKIRTILLHTVATLTVKQNQPIDFYTCNVGDYWLTHTIDWSKLCFQKQIRQFLMLSPN